MVGEYDLYDVAERLGRTAVTAVGIFTLILGAGMIAEDVALPRMGLYEIPHIRKVVNYIILGKPLEEAYGDYVGRWDKEAHKAEEKPMDFHEFKKYVRERDMKTEW